MTRLGTEIGMLIAVVLVILGKSLPRFDDILKLYSCFTHGTMTTVKQVCIRHRPKKLSIDIRSADLHISM